MARKVTPSQLRSMIRQAEQKQKQAIDKYNREVRRYNQDVRRRQQKAKQAADKFNREVRAHNTRVRTNRQRIQNEINRLNRTRTTTRYTVYRSTVVSMHETYSRLETTASQRSLGPYHQEFMDLSERENANSLEAMNLVVGGDQDDDDDEVVEEDIQTSQMKGELREISPDLDARWGGALFALNPRNPDAARHFCTSAREIIVQILEVRAPDSEVLRVLPDCAKTEHGKPTRRSKVNFLLRGRSITEPVAGDFVEQDIDSVIELFEVFNKATHGSAGKYGIRQLFAIKRRVEDGIRFLSRLSRG